MQTFFANVQRGWKLHPLGGLIGLGTFGVSRLLGL